MTMMKSTEQRDRFLFSLILAGVIVWVVAAYPCVSYAAGSGSSGKLGSLLSGGNPGSLFSRGSGLSSMSSGSSGKLGSLFSGGSGGGSLLGGGSSSGGDKSQSFLYRKAETCPFRQMYISGAAKEGSMTYEIGKSVDELYKSMGGTSTEITESDCEICNVLAGALGGESYDQYQQQLAQGKTTTTANTAGVTVYTAPGCGYCDQIKQLLKEKGISYKEIDITKDTLAAGEMVAKTGQTGVPVTVINGKYVVGYKPEEIEKLLGTSTTFGQTSAQKTAAPAQKAATTQKSAQKASTGSGSDSSLSGLLGGGSGMLGGGSGGGIFSKMLGGGSSGSSISGLLGGGTGASGQTSAQKTTITQKNTQKTVTTTQKSAQPPSRSSSSSAGFSTGVGHITHNGIHIWYPTDSGSGPYPLVVFSHGLAFGTATQCSFFTEGLSKHGYVTCAMNHSTSMKKGMTSGLTGEPGYLDVTIEIQDEIDQLLSLNNDPGSELYGLIDENAIGVTGHSCGGWAAEVICGASDDEKYIDERVKAGCFYAPANFPYNMLGDILPKDAGVNMHTASMWFFGTMDEMVRASSNRFVYDNAPAPKYCAVISGMDHFMPAISGTGKCPQVMEEYAAAFFDRYLKNDTSADEILQTEHSAFASYEYELGEGGSGTAAGSRENDDPWEEIPVYGLDLEKMGEW